MAPSVPEPEDSRSAQPTSETGLIHGKAASDLETDPEHQEVPVPKTQVFDLPLKREAVEARIAALRSAIDQRDCFFIYQASACTRRPPGVRPQAAKWVRIFRKIGEPKKQHGTPRDMICHCITKVGRREHGKWVSIFL